MMFLAFIFSMAFNSSAQFFETEQTVIKGTAVAVIEESSVFCAHLQGMNIDRCFELTDGRREITNAVVQALIPMNELTQARALQTLAAKPSTTASLLTSCAQAQRELVSFCFAALAYGRDITDAKINICLNDINPKSCFSKNCPTLTRFGACSIVDGRAVLVEAQENLVRP